MVLQVADSVWNLGDGVFNFYVLEEAGRLTLVDAGLRGDWGRLVRGLRAIGHQIGDIEAVLLTHAHRDHTGEAERARREGGARVFIHPEDEPFARQGGSALGGGVPAEGGFVLGPGMLKVLFRAARNAVASRSLRVPGIEELTPLADGERIDVPGRPVAHHVPGHTPGSVVFHCASHDLIFSGDALVTLDVVSGRRGPGLTHRAFNFDTSQARESLTVLAGLAASVLLPGHGEPWREGTAEAVARARRRVS